MNKDKIKNLFKVESKQSFILGCITGVVIFTFLFFMLGVYVSCNPATDCEELVW